LHQSIELGRHLLGMRDQQEGDTLFLAGLSNEVDDLLLMAGIDARRRLIGEEELRTIGERPGHGDALLLPDGELGGLVSFPVGKADALEQVPCTSGIATTLSERHPEHDVFERRESGEQVERLEDVSDRLRAEPVTLRLAEARDVAPVDEDLPGIRSADSGDGVQDEMRPWDWTT
jgi:hypothetical protein